MLVVYTIQFQVLLFFIARMSIIIGIDIHSACPAFTFNIVAERMVSLIPGLAMPILSLIFITNSQKGLLFWQTCSFYWFLTIGTGNDLLDSLFHWLSFERKIYKYLSGT